MLEKRLLFDKITAFFSFVFRSAGANFLPFIIYKHLYAIFEKKFTFSP